MKNSAKKEYLVLNNVDTMTSEIFTRAFHFRGARAMTEILPMFIKTDVLLAVGTYYHPSFAQIDVISKQCTWRNKFEMFHSISKGVNY